ncbi:uncharacterized protein [Zea mays]|uniref:uncharacterized protein n=1 Tax=Zea mays TaxID=4577 RepID=UPI0009AADF17|nr:uncharacterized protein LOC103644605 [Zea mays]|eukprot:XP_020397027.1 uncharacterized protein LOC103644605 [Zea mays]
MVEALLATVNVNFQPEDQLQNHQMTAPPTYPAAPNSSPRRHRRLGPQRGPILGDRRSLVLLHFSHCSRIRLRRERRVVGLLNRGNVTVAAQMTGGFSGWASGAGGSAMANQATQDLGAVQCEMEGDRSYYTNLINGGFDTFEDIPETPIELQHTPSIELQQTPPVVRDLNMSSKQNHKAKGKKFSEDEDRLLVSAWLNVSTNPTQGTNQTRGTFWKRIYVLYEENRRNDEKTRNYAERSEGSLLHRWSSIQDAVSKFCGCINSIENRNQSGLTIHDRVDQAEKLFKSQDAHRADRI